MHDKCLKNTPFFLFFVYAVQVSKKNVSTSPRKNFFKKTFSKKKIFSTFFFNFFTNPPCGGVNQAVHLGWRSSHLGTPRHLYSSVSLALPHSRTNNGC